MLHEGKVPKGKEAVAAEMRPAVPGAWYGGDRFVIMFTCSKCGTRTAKTVSKLAYNKGVVLIRCPGCQALHLMADRLGWFANVEAGEKTLDIVDLMKRKGEAVRAVSPLNASVASGDEDAATGEEPPATPSDASASAGSAVGTGEASADGPTPLDLELMEGVMELTEEDIKVLQAEGKFVLGQTPQAAAAAGDGDGDGNGNGGHAGSHDGDGSHGRA